MLDDQERGPRVVEESSDGVVHLHDTVRVEVRARLVEHQRTRPHREDPRERQPLPLTAGQPRGGAVERQVEPDDVERVPDPEPGLAALDTEVLTPERHVVADPGHHGVGLGVLHDEADPPADGAGCSAVDEHAAADLGGGVVSGVGLVGQDRGDGTEERGLARAGGPDDRDALSGLHDQVDTADGPGVAIGVAPTPVPELDPGGVSVRHAHAAEDGRRFACSRPTANEDNTPVRASARTISQEPMPAMTAPVIAPQTM